MDIRVGLIGYGYAGRVLHTPLIRSVPGLHLTTIASTKPVDQIQSELGPVTVCTAAQMARQDVDLIVIVTPNTEHFPLALAAMEAGKHVVVDKPFTLDLAEAKKLRDVARQTGRMLTVFQNRRWDSEVLAIKDVLQSGILGQVVQFDCRMNRYRPNVRQRWRENPGPGAGLWFDLGPHLIDLTVHLFGLPSAVQADFATLREGGLTDDWGHVLLTYDHMRVVLETTLLASGPLPRSVLHGTNGTWVKYGLDVQEAQLQAGMSPRDPAFGIDPTSSYFHAGDGSTRELPPVPGNQVGFYEGVRDAIREGKPAPVSLEDAIAVMTILETSFQSAEEKRTLPLSFEPA